MEFTISVQKRHFLTILGAILLLTGVFAVYAYNSTQSDPSYLGHSANELEGVCLSNGTGCPTEMLNISVALNVSSNIPCQSPSGTRSCSLGSSSEWDACFLTQHTPTTSGGSWDASCTIARNATNWMLQVWAGSDDGIRCSAQCIKLR